MYWSTLHKIFWCWWDDGPSLNNKWNVIHSDNYFLLSMHVWSWWDTLRDDVFLLTEAARSTQGRNDISPDKGSYTPILFFQMLSLLTHKDISPDQGCTNCGILASGLRGNGERMRKWWENEEMEREWGNEERLTLCISSFSIHFFPLSPFPTSKFVTFYCKMLNTALLSRMSQKT